MQKEKLTIIVIDLLSSSIIMLPYCKSLWQNPIRWLGTESSFSSIEISFSIESNWKALASSGLHNLLAVLSQFLERRQRVGCRYDKSIKKI